MKVEFMAAALALCLASGTAIAQQTTMTPTRGVTGSSLVRPCTALTSTSDCAIGLRNLRLGGAGLMTSPNSVMQQNGSGLGSAFLRGEGAGPLEANGPTDRLSRGISRGGMAGSSMAGSSMAVGPLGVDDDSLLRNGLGGASLGGGSLGGRSAAGSLGGGSSRLR
jgi:hypothetical protein